MTGGLVRFEDYPDDYRAEAQAVYDAQEATEFRLTDYDGVDAPEGWDESLTVDEVEPFAEAAIAAAGWGSDGPPLIFVYDVPDDCDRAGYYRYETGTIHLHPRLLGKFTILHEVAHFLDPRQIHGPRFVAIFARLIGATFGPEVGRVFIEECEARDVPIDYPHVDLGD